MYDWANSGFQRHRHHRDVRPVSDGARQTGRRRERRRLRAGTAPRDGQSRSFRSASGSSVFLQVFLLPVLGAIADYTNLKKRLMAFFCYVGQRGHVPDVLRHRQPLSGRAAFLLVVANLCFGASLVLYNAFLNDIATEDRRDNVSSRGYALGYLGGGVLLLANLILLQNAATLGIDDGLAVRLSFLSAGLWWAGFSIVTFRRLQSRQAAITLPAGRSVISAGFAELAASFRALRRLPQHAALSCGLHAVQRRHPDLHRHGLAVSLAGALCRPRPSRRSVIPDRTGSDDSVRGVLRRAALRAYRGLHGHQAGHPDLPGHLGFGDHLTPTGGCRRPIRRGYWEPSSRLCWEVRRRCRVRSTHG